MDIYGFLHCAFIVSESMFYFQATNKNCGCVLMLLKAYAKINLSLHVLGTRPDSYHELRTVMQTIDLYDILEISMANDIELELELIDPKAELSAGEDNLACRAALLLRQHTGFSGGARIKLVKKIPLAAGLAGGSADAAAVLRGLNCFWDLNLSPAELMEIGALIGSDVPFCLLGGTALAWGRGEIIEQLPALPTWGVLLVKPTFGLSTAQVYRLYDQSDNFKHQEKHNSIQLGGNCTLRSLSACLSNDLEKAVLPLYPEIKNIQQAIAAVGATGVLMSGSGPTVFGLFADKSMAERATAQLCFEDGQVYVTEFCTIE